MAEQSLNDLTIDFHQILAMPLTQRRQMEKNGDVDQLAEVMSPSEIAALFPDYFKDDLNALAGQKSDFGPPGAIPSPNNTNTNNFTAKSPNSQPVNPSQTSTEVKKGISPTQFRNIEKNPLLAGYADSVGEKDASPNSKFSYENKNGKLSDNQREAYAAARSEGLDDAAAKALVANMTGESLRDPSNVHADPSHSNPNQKAHGIVSWDDQRSAAIQKEFGKMPNEMTVSEQVKAAIWEMKNKYPKTYEALKDSKVSVEAKIGTLVSDYERPANPDRDTNTRIGFLKGIQDIDKDVKEEKPVQKNNKPATASDVSSALDTGGKNPATQKDNQTAKEVNAVPTSGTLRPIDKPLDYLKSRNPRNAKLDEVDPILLKSSSEGIQQFEANHPEYRVELFGPSSGERDSGHTSNHGLQSNGKGGALDFVIIDKKTGKQLANNNSAYAGQIGKPGDTAPLYTELHDSSRLAQMHYFPNTTPLAIGPSFEGGYNPFDLMHEDITHKNGMLGYHYTTGFAPEQMKRWDIKENVVLGKDAEKTASSVFGELDKNGNYVNRITTVHDEQSKTATLTAAKMINQDKPAIKQNQPDVKKSAIHKEFPLEQFRPRTEDSAVKKPAPAPVIKKSEKPLETSEAKTQATASMASGGILTEPHLAINKRTGAMVNLAEEGTGGEVVIPKTRIKMEEMHGRQTNPNQGKSPANSLVNVRKKINAQKNSGNMRTIVQKPTAMPAYRSHPPISASASKAYARARMEKPITQPDYVEYGYPLF